MKVALVGPYPPPVGGIAVQIQRIAARLRAGGHDVRVFDTAGGQKSAPEYVVTGYPKWRLALRTGPFLRAEVVHVHVHAQFIGLWVVAWARLTGKRSVVTVHSMRLSPKDVGIVRRTAIRLALRLASEIVVVGAHIADGVRKWLPSARPLAIPSFLPPAMDRVPEHALTDELTEFIRRHDPVLCVGAYRVVFHEGVDLYGLDLSVQLVLRLRVAYPNVGLVMVVADAEDRVYLGDLRHRAVQSGAGEAVFLLAGTRELWPIMREIDLFLRPTLSDGSSFPLSVGEALVLGVPTVASDAASRPPEVRTFQSRDLDDMERVVREVLERLDEERARLADYHPPDFLAPLLDVYRGASSDARPRTRTR